MSFLDELESIIKSRKNDAPENSYTAKLLQGNVDRILKKITEEAGEVVIAAKNRDKDEIANETADLLFHLLVMLNEQGMTLQDALAILEARHSSKTQK